MRTHRRPHERTQRRALPAPGRQRRVRDAQGMQARGDQRLLRLALKRLGGNGLHRRQRIVDAMEEFADEQIALFLGLFAVRDVAKDHSQSACERKQAVGEPSPREDHRLCFRLDRLAPRHGVEEQLTEVRVARARKDLPQHLADDLRRRSPEMAGRFAVEPGDAPFSIDGIEPLADPVQDGRKVCVQTFGYGRKAGGRQGLLVVPARACLEIGVFAARVKGSRCKEC